jgi:hypothetical protein
MDLPVSIVEWELFVPNQYSVKPAGGNMLERRLVDRDAGTRTGTAAGSASGSLLGAGRDFVKLSADALPGQIVGRATDPSGAVLPGVTVVLEAGRSRRAVITGTDGAFQISGVPSGQVSLTAALAGFRSRTMSLAYDQEPRHVEFVLDVGGLNEEVIVSAEQPARKRREADRPSPNVLELQRRAAGVLPVRVEVPRAGTSHTFVKPLVVDQQATVVLRYKRR